MIQWSQQIETSEAFNSFFTGARVANDGKGIWGIVGWNDTTLIGTFGSGGNADLTGAVTWQVAGQLQSNNGWLTGASPSIGLYRLGSVPVETTASPFAGAVDAALVVWADGNKLMYVAGVNRISGLTPQQYDSGAAPSVSLDAYAANASAIPVVEVHQGSAGYSQLWYRVGYIKAGPVNASNPDATTLSVAWSNSHPISGSFGNAYGTVPSVVVAAGYVVVVFEGSKGKNGNLWYDVGKLNGTTIDWLSQENYSSGANPSIGLTPTYFGQPYQNPSSIVETHTDTTNGTATYRSGTWNNQSSPTSISWNGGDAVMAGNACQPSVALDENSAAGFIWLPQCLEGNSLGWGLAYRYWGDNGGRLACRSGDL